MSQLCELSPVDSFQKIASLSSKGKIFWNNQQAHMSAGVCSKLRD